MGPTKARRVSAAVGRSNHKSETPPVEATGGGSEIKRSNTQ
jgi:hypothetical protein